MPKVVDHEQRRRELAAALWRVVVEGGAQAVSVRSVAAAAGFSAGALRHYFASQDELLAFALDMIREQVAERLRTCIAGAARLDRTEAAAAMLETLLPLDEQRKAEVTVWMGFSVRTWNNASMADLRRDGLLGSAYVSRLAVATAAGTLPPQDLTSALPNEDYERFARHLQVAVDGWCVQLLFYPGLITSEKVMHEVRDNIARWLDLHGNRDHNVPWQTNERGRNKRRIQSSNESKENT